MSQSTTKEEKINEILIDIITRASSGDELLRNSDQESKNKA